VTAAADWTAVTATATLLVALATLGLAFATLRLVRFTKEEAEAVRQEAAATEKQAEITVKALVSSTRPWLTVYLGPSPIGIPELAPVALENGVERLNQVGIKGHVVVRNAGQGLAVIPKDSSWVWGRDSEDRVFGKSAYAFPRSSILPPGEFTPLEFFVSGVPYDRFVGSKVGFDFFVHVLYTDADGGQPVVASFRVSAYPERPPSVFEISYRHLSAVPSLSDAHVFDEAEPFAVVRPGLPG
jgi:hypothetical protein